MQVVGSLSGEEEMEYWRTRIGGSMARKAPRGRVAVGWASRRSRGERRLAVIAAVKAEPDREERAVRLASSGMVEAIAATF